jgi:hypothetical protein
VLAGGRVGEAPGVEGEADRVVDGTGDTAVAGAKVAALVVGAAVKAMVDGAGDVGN